jgi:MFS family permease
MVTKEIFNRNFSLVFLGQLAFTSAFHILIPTLPIYLSRSGSVETEIGVLIGVFSVSSLIIRPSVGRTLLRTPERNFMIAGSLLFGLSSIAYLVAPPFWPFFMVRIFQGIGLAFFNTASITLVANVSPDAHRGQSFGYFYLAFNFAFALAPSFGMFVINTFNFTVLFFFSAGLSLCSLFITTKLAKREIDLPIDSSISEDSFLSRKAIPPAVMVFFAHIIWGALTAFFPLYALNHGVSNPGFFFTAYAVVLILGRTLGGKILDHYSREKIIFPCLTTYILSMVILAFSKTLPMFILVAVIWGIGNAFLIPTLVAHTIELAGSSRGPAMGTFTALADFGTGMGPVVMGIILRMTSYQAMFLCLALTGLLNLYLFYRKSKSLPHPVGE